MTAIETAIQKAIEGGYGYIKDDVYST